MQLPPRGFWTSGGQARYATLEAWTGREPEPAPSIDAIVIRYLEAFGPASPLDAQRWSGLTRLGEVFERLRPQLLTFRGEDGKQLFDVPNGPRPDPDVPAPPRFLGQLDNVLLGHADRRRIIPPQTPSLVLSTQGRDRDRFINHVLIDGRLGAAWWIERTRRAHASLIIRPFEKLSEAQRDEVADEGHRMVDFAAADAEHRDVRFTG